MFARKPVSRVWAAASRPDYDGHLLLDTHVWVWMLEGDLHRISAAAVDLDDGGKELPTEPAADGAEREGADRGVEGDVGPVGRSRRLQAEQERLQAQQEHLQAEQGRLQAEQERLQAQQALRQAEQALQQAAEQVSREVALRQAAEVRLAELEAQLRAFQARGSSETP